MLVRFARALLLLSILAAPIGCKGKEHAASGTPTPHEQAPPAPAATPDDIGKAIGQAYKDAVAAVAALVANNPPAAELAPKVQALKDATITKLVALGRQRQSLDAAGNAKINGIVSQAMASVDMTAFKAMADAVNFYRPADNALAENLAAFNIITQYADFELLAKQAPDEAKRLGVP